MELEGLIVQVQESGKYRAVSPELVRQLATQEAAKGRSVKETVKAIRNRLHQVGGAYLEAGTDYDRWLVSLQAAEGQASLQAACREVLGHHASTRERLTILDQFYPTVLAGLPPLHSVLDVACGFNPLAIPWLPLAADALYYACDIYADMVAFLNASFPLLGVQGAASQCDLTQTIPNTAVDIAFILKTIPCLEQVDKAAGSRLLDGLHARWLLVSFPTRSLGGRSKGMGATYEAHFNALVAGRGWQIARFEFPGELVFLVDKQP